MDTQKDSPAPSKPESEPVRRWTFDTFKSKLIQAVTVHPPTMASLPQTIDTGIFGQRTEELKAKTATDPHKREYLLMAKLDLNNKIVLLDKPVQGDIPTSKSAEVSFIPKIEQKIGIDPVTGREELIKTERPVLLLHSHPDQIPASPQDVGSIIGDIDEFDHVASMIGIPGQNLLLLRTLTTPEFSKPEVTKWVGKWTKEYYRRISQLPGYLIGAARLANAAVINNNLLREMLHEVDVAVFSTKEGNTYTRATL